MMWAFIFIFMFAAFIAACIYLITRVRKFVWVDKLAKGRRITRYRLTRWSEV